MVKNKTSRTKKIETIAGELIASKKNGIALIMGAGCSISSGVPLWDELAYEVLAKLSINVEGDSVQALENYLEEQPSSKDIIEDLVKQRLNSAYMSKGYDYLAQLVASGYYRTIVTLNWDTLLEDALGRKMSHNKFTVLSRDLVSDENIAKVLENIDGDTVVVVKLHGDPMMSLRMGDGVSTRAMHSSLRDALARRFKRVHIVGTKLSDIDVLQPLFARANDGNFLMVSPNAGSSSGLPSDLCQSVISGQFVANGSTLDDQKSNKGVNPGEFDHFFCQLYLSIEKSLLTTSERKKNLVKVEKDILRKEEFGQSHISSIQLKRLADVLMSKMRKEGSPDIAFFINDPSAPGGMELKKLVEESLEKNGVRVEVLEISGESGNRSFKRSYRGDKSDMARTDIPNEGAGMTMHVLDAITFSGNTLNIAKETLLEWYPRATVRMGVVFVSQMLSEKGISDIDYGQITDRYEIFFPWGVTQTTSDITRIFESIEENRQIQIIRRPWGSNEVLVDEERCSVRLLTIEAGKKLSFQRHFCRDELFVALDDNIGLDLCAEELDLGKDIFQPAVKSIILEKSDYALVSRGVWHRTKASMDRARLLEIGFGIYDQQYDIERCFDDYDRLQDDGAI